MTCDCHKCYSTKQPNTMENMGFEDTDGGKFRVRGNNNNGHLRKKNTDHLGEEKLHIYKNLLLISFSFLLLFTAYESMSKLQSSINSVANLGTWSNTAVYASLVLSTCFLPSIIINRLKANKNLRTRVDILFQTTRSSGLWWPAC